MNTCSLYSKLFWALLFVSQFFLPLAFAVKFSVSESMDSRTGYIQISWEANQQTEFELQQSLNSEFIGAKTIYRGSDKAVFLSGFKDDTYYFRVRSFTNNEIAEPWSKTKTLNVIHHSLTTAFTLFFLGLFSFLAILIVIFLGHRKYRLQARIL